MPANSGRFKNLDFKNLIEKYGFRGVDASRKALENVEGLEYRDGVLGDLGDMYHRAFGSQLTFFL